MSSKKKKKRPRATSETSKMTSKRISANEFQQALEQRFQSVSYASKNKPKTKNKSKNKIKSTAIHKGVFSIPHFLSTHECKDIIQLTEQRGFTLTDQRETRYAAHRRNGRIQCQSPELANILYQRIKTLFPSIIDETMGTTSRTLTSVGLNSNFRFYKYEVGDRFGMHIDDSVDQSTEHGDGALTAYTLLIYLNGDLQGLQGGATNFYDGDVPKKTKLIVSFEPKEGAALVHEHYPTCMLHEGAAVTQGCKYLMRTDVVYR